MDIIMLSYSLIHLELNIHKYSNIIQSLEENKKNDTYALVLQQIIKTQTTSSIKLTHVRFAFLIQYVYVYVDICDDTIYYV